LNIRGLDRRAIAARVESRPAVAPGVRGMLLFLGPLVFTGMMMTTDTPIINAALARLPHPEEALAAFVVAFALAMVYEAPHIMMIEAGTTLATNARALGLLRRFYGLLALTVGIIGALVVFSPIYDALVMGLMQIPPRVAASARPALAVFLLWPLPIGWRRLHQGALIRRGHSRAVGAGAFARIGALIGGMLTLVPLLSGALPGTAIGALVMLLSVSAESLYTHRAAGRLLADLPLTAPDGHDLTMRELWTFYWPLAGTSILNTLNRPILSAGLAVAAGATLGAAGADAALAAWGVAWGLLFLVNGATLTLQQVAIAWDASPDPALRRRCDRLILGLGLGLSAIVALSALTPIAGWLLDTIYAVSPPVRAAALPVLTLLAPVPMLFTAGALLRGKLIHRRQTRLVQRAQIIDLLVMIGVLALGLYWPLPGARPAATTLGALAMLAVYCADLGVVALGVRANPRARALPGLA
jgi:progressive ankylosis protein